MALASKPRGLEVLKLLHHPLHPQLLHGLLLHLPHLGLPAHQVTQVV